MIFILLKGSRDETNNLFAWNIVKTPTNIVVEDFQVESKEGATKENEANP